MNNQRPDDYQFYTVVVRCVPSEDQKLQLFCTRIAVFSRPKCEPLRVLMLQRIYRCSTSQGFLRRSARISLQGRPNPDVDKDLPGVLTEPCKQNHPGLKARMKKCKLIATPFNGVLVRKQAHPHHAFRFKTQLTEAREAANRTDAWQAHVCNPGFKRFPPETSADNCDTVAYLSSVSLLSVTIGRQSLPLVAGK